jgi:hypothetical protein
VLALCADARLAPDGSGRAPARGGTRSVRHLEERVLPATPGPPVSGIVFDLDDTLVPMKRWLRDRLLLALERLVEPGERAAARLAALRIIEEGPRDRLIDAVAGALGWGEERRASLLEHYPTTGRRAWRATPTSARRSRRCGAAAEARPAHRQSSRHPAKEAEALAPVPALTRSFARELGAEKFDRRGFAAIARRSVAAGAARDGRRCPHRDLAGAALRASGGCLGAPRGRLERSTRRSSPLPGRRALRSRADPREPWRGSARSERPGSRLVDLSVRLNGGRSKSGPAGTAAGNGPSAARTIPASIRD